MTLSLLLPAALLLTMTAGLEDDRVGDAATVIADACLEGASRSNAHQVLRSDVRELRGGQQALRSEHLELRNGQGAIRSGQEELTNGQAAIRSDQEELRNGQGAIRSGQEELSSGQVAIRSGQEELRNGQGAIRSGQEELSSGQAAIRSGQERMQGQISAIQEQLAALQPSAGGCPGGWSRHENSCYFIPSYTATWIQAHRHCALLDRRARLASVHPGSSRHIASLVANTGTGRPSNFGVWIGLVKLDGGDRWGWSDGTPLDFVNWSRHEPTPGEVEQCGHVWGPLEFPNSKGWNNNRCHVPLSFMCQITLE